MKVLDFEKQAWKRPSDWIQTPFPNEDEIIMLYPVRATDNNFAVKVEGDYIINWGDGVVETYTSGTQAEHSYAYDSLNAPLDNTGCKQVIIKIKPQEDSNITKFTLKLTLASGKPNNSILEFKGNLPFYKNSWSYNFYNQWKLKNALFYNLPDITYFQNVFENTLIENTNFPFNKVSGYVDGLYKRLNRPNKYKAKLDTTNFTNIHYILLKNADIEELEFIGDNPNCLIHHLYGSNQIKKVTIKNKIYVSTALNLFNGDWYLKEIDGIENIDYSQSDGNFSGMFYGCNSLKRIICDMSNTTNATNFITYAYSLQELKLTNIPKINIDIKYSNVTREQLIEIFESLPDASGDDTSSVLTITGCRGVVDLSDDDKAIATDKNWTLVT